MENYEVEELARQRNKDALFKMAWQPPDDVKNSHMDHLAWQNYWFEKAADAGHVDAKYRYAKSLLAFPLSIVYRNKAMRLFQSLVNDFDAGKLFSDEDKEAGSMAKLWLGIMLCEGYLTVRDAERGVELINAAKDELEDFKDFGLMTLYNIGELYSTGLVDPSELEEPTFDDLVQALAYYDKAIKAYDPERNKREIFELVTKMYDNTEKWIKRVKEQEGGVLIFEDTKANRLRYTKERRGKRLELSDKDHKKLDDYSKAIKQLRERLASEGW